MLNYFITNSPRGANGIFSILFNSIQNLLLPELEEESGELTARQMEFIRAIFP